jgi:hypothetical protein
MFSDSQDPVFGPLFLGMAGLWLFQSCIRLFPAGCFDQSGKLEKYLEIPCLIHSYTIFLQKNPSQFLVLSLAKQEESGYSGDLHPDRPGQEREAGLYRTPVRGG